MLSLLIVLKFVTYVSMALFTFGMLHEFRRDVDSSYRA